MEAERNDTVKPVGESFELKDGRQLIIKEAEIQDAEAMLSFATMLFTTCDQVLTTPEEFSITLEEERGYIHSHAVTHTALLLVAVDGNEVVGLLNFNCHSRMKMKHTGEFGVSVHPDYRQQGIARKMIQCLINWATKIQEIEKIVLHVLHTNTGAIKLYKDLGFAIEGREIKAVRQPDGTYADLVCMGWQIERMG